MGSGIAVVAQAADFERPQMTLPLCGLCHFRSSSSCQRQQTTSEDVKDGMVIIPGWQWYSAEMLASRSACAVPHVHSCNGQGDAGLKQQFNHLRLLNPARCDGTHSWSPALRPWDITSSSARSASPTHFRTPSETFWAVSRHVSATLYCSVRFDGGCQASSCQQWSSSAQSGKCAQQGTTPSTQRSDMHCSICSCCHVCLGVVHMRA
jgi:hypothetical protein